jgi:energy-converting hydrogenase Eha subunit H
MEVAQLDTAVLIAAAGGMVTVAVQLAKMAYGGVITPRASVLTAGITGLCAVALYAFSNNLFTQPNAFGLAAAWIAVTATGAGIYATANATTRSS